jgi:cobalt-zinc-cadmium efflux system outer membrane protein
VATTLRFRDNILPRSEAAAYTTEKTYLVGETSLLEVLDARRTLLDSRRLYLSALAKAHLDCNRLGVLVGEETQ